MTSRILNKILLCSVGVLAFSNPLLSNNNKILETKTFYNAVENKKDGPFESIVYQYPLKKICTLLRKGGLDKAVTIGAWHKIMFVVKHLAFKEEFESINMLFFNQYKNKKPLFDTLQEYCADYKENKNNKEYKELQGLVEMLKPLKTKQLQDNCNN